LLNQLDICDEQLPPASKLLGVAGHLNDLTDAHPKADVCRIAPQQRARQALIPICQGEIARPPHAAHLYHPPTRGEKLIG
jgi:hypothetical protein